MTKDQIKAYEEQLKPCPFCGEKPFLEQDSVGNWFVGCENIACECMPTTDSYKDPIYAVNGWNKRGEEE